MKKAAALHDWILLDQGIDIPLDRAGAIVETVAPHIASLDSLLEELPPEAEITSFLAVLKDLKPA